VSERFRQQVPRPASAVAARGSWRRSSVTWSEVVTHATRLAGAQQAPAAAGSTLRAAVLVPLYAGPGGDPVVVLTRRSSGLARDPGHVAFPGGLVEAGEQPLATALREAEEEIGLAPEAVTAVAPLGSYTRALRHEQIEAYLGLLAGEPLLVPHEREVEAVLHVPLGELLAEGTSWSERWGERTVYFFSEGEDLVWGMTARVLWDLLSGLTGGAPPA